MGIEIIDELVKQSPLIALLAVSGYVLWKRYERFVDRTQTRLEESEQRQRKYNEEDRGILLKIVHDNTDAMRNIGKLCDRSNRVMECLIDEIKDFKKSEVYKSHKNQSHH